MINKKIIFVFSAFCMYASLVLGQVGINTITPASTLEVVAGNGSLPEGIIAPHQTLQQVISKSSLYTPAQTGIFVFIDDTSGGTNTKTENITSTGYYYYDGTVWQPFSGTASPITNDWSIEGNDNLSATRGENYLGTKNAKDLVFKTNAVEQMTISSAGNVGIGTSSPTNKLHIKDSNNPIKIEGLSASTSTDDKPIVIGTDGVLKTGDFPKIDLVPDDVGTVIAIDGELQVAQEITVLMTADFSFTAQAYTPSIIGNLTNVIIDNHNTFKSNSTSNSFTVDADGTYLITMNVQIKNSTGNPVIGIWCDNCQSTISQNPIGRWVARVNDYIGWEMQTFTLITAIEMYKDNTYSFRVAGATAGIIPWSSFGSTGSGPISFYSLKRLR